MRTIGTFLFVLTAGILSCTVALGHIPSQKSLLLSILEIAHSPDAPEAIDKLLIESCEKNGGLKAYNSAKKGLKYFVSCTQRAASKMNHMPYIAKEDLVATMKKACAMVSTEETCVEKLKDSIEPCLELEEHETTRIIYNIMKSSVEFICAEDGARIAKFYNDGGEKCLVSKQQAVANCLNEFSSHYTSSTSSDRELTTGLNQALTFVPNIKDCIHIDELQLCIVNMLKKCEPHAPADIADSLFNSVKKGIDCKNSRKSQASASSFANCALIISAMAIVLPFN